MWSVDLLVHPLSIVSAPYQGEEAHHCQEGELTSEGGEGGEGGEGDSLSGMREMESLVYWQACWDLTRG